MNETKIRKFGSLSTAVRYRDVYRVISCAKYFGKAIYSDRVGMTRFHTPRFD